MSILRVYNTKFRLKKEPARAIKYQKMVGYLTHHFLFISHILSFPFQREVYAAVSSQPLKTIRGEGYAKLFRASLKALNFSLHH
jgi:hypothetical protein